MQVKKRIFAGAVCEQIVYETSGTKATKQPRIRFKSEDERDEHKRLISKRHHSLLVNENFTTTSIYSTLTFSQEYECHDFIDARIMRDRFWRNIRLKFPKAKMIIYMGKGARTSRIHIHLISDGIPIEQIEKYWIFGTIAKHSFLREHNIDPKTGIDLGKDYTALADYCFNHWTKEQGKGKRYKATKNLKQPEEEKAKICARRYSENKPPRTPKGYIYTGIKTITKYGYMMFHYVKNPQTDFKCKVFAPLPPPLPQ